MVDKNEKSTRWAITAYEGNYPILDAIRKEGNPLIAEIGWQDEICKETQRPHRQGYIRTVRQVRFGQLQAQIGTIHLEKATNWDGLVNYCRKVETRDPSGEQVHLQFARPMRLHEMLIEVAKNIIADSKRLGETLSSLDRQTDRQILLRLLRDYAHPIVRRHPEYAPVLCRQDARDTWCEFFEVWMEKADEGGGEGQ